MTDRECVLSRLPEAKPSLLPEVWTARTVAGDLWAQFWERFLELGGSRTTWEALSGQEGKRWSVDAGLVVPETAGPYVPSSPWDADLGLTRALAAVAETGSLVVSGGRRQGSLAPPVHVAVLREADVVGTLEEAVSLMPSQSSVIVTGPSRTADIEGVLVRGVHGPREVRVIVSD